MMTKELLIGFANDAFGTTRKYELQDTGNGQYSYRLAPTIQTSINGKTYLAYSASKPYSKNKSEFFNVHKETFEVDSGWLEE